MKCASDITAPHGLRYPPKKTKGLDWNGLPAEKRHRRDGRIYLSSRRSGMKSEHAERWGEASSAFRDEA